MSTFVASPRSSAEGAGLRYEGQGHWFRSQTYNLIPAFPLAIGGILINFVYPEPGFLICNMGMITESVPETVARPREGARCLAQGLAHSRCAINSLLEMLFPPQPEFFVAGGNFLCLSPDQKPGPFTANRLCVCIPCPCPRLSMPCSQLEPSVPQVNSFEGATGAPDLGLLASRSLTATLAPSTWPHPPP